VGFGDLPRVRSLTAFIAIALTAGCGSKRARESVSTTERIEIAAPSATASAAVAAMSNPAVPSRDFVPDKLDAVIAGVLRWENPRLQTFDARNRKDAELHQTLLARGTKADRLSLLLDENATRAKILEDLRRAGKRAKEGGTVVFYYAGHGVRDEAGKISFANFDIDPETPGTTGLTMADISDALATVPKSTRVILMADCCFSGALKEVVDSLSSRGIAAASITSADASNTSTVNWTFTQTVIDALSGSGIHDRDGDGTIALSELGTEVSDAMKFRDRQRSGFIDKGVGGSFALARVVGSSTYGSRLPGGFAVGDYGVVKRNGADEAGRVMGGDASALNVRLYHYADAEDVVVNPAEIAKPIFKQYIKDTVVTVLWEGKEWEAKVVRTDDDFHFITYPGWPSYWDEWILSDRVVRQGFTKQAAPTTFSVGAKVLVEWQTKWWPAVVTKQNGDQYFIHYDGYDASWDEWVTLRRIRSRQP
jgi:hypothetical protein